MPNASANLKIRATAMIEMVLALPIIFVTLSLLFFVGRGVVRVQHALVMDRHDAWNKAAHLVTDTPTDIHVLLRSYRQSYATLPVGPTQINNQLDEAFMGNKGEVETLDHQYVDNDTSLAYDYFVEQSDLSDDAKNTYDAMTSFSQISHSIQTSLRSEFDEDSTALWRRLAGDIQHGHRRDDLPWAFTQGYSQLRVERGDFVIMEPADMPEWGGPRLLHITNTTGNEFYIRVGDLVTISEDERYDLWQPYRRTTLDPTRGTTSVNLVELYTQFDGLNSSLGNAVNSVYRGHHPYHYAGPTPYWFGPDIYWHSYRYSWRSH